MEQRHPPKDKNGKRLRIGDRVRIVGVPDLTGMAPRLIAESQPVFQHLVGTYKRIVEFDKLGCAWLDFVIRKGKFRGMHGVAIEPFLLHLPQKQKALRSRTRRKG